MRRLTVISAFALFLALPLWAQHGGGHAGGGHAGFGGVRSGGFSGRASFGGSHAVSGGARSMASHGSFPQHSSSHGPFLHDGFHTHTHTHVHSNCFGCRGWGHGYPLWGWGYYDPYWWNSHSSYDDDYNQNLAEASQMNQQSLEQQRMLRQEEARGDQDAYAQRSSASHPAAGQGSAIVSPTVLIFRDQHKQEIQNYAIVGQTLWNFAPQRTQKIPLADLDLGATEKANDDRGVSFRIPSANEGQ